VVRFTSVSLDLTGAPAHPGDTLDLSGTGGGADPAGDAGGSSGDQTVDGNFIVIVGDRQITPLYAGTVAGSPGAWRISFTLPSDIPPDCFAAVQVSAGGEFSNAVSIPIAAPGESACSDPQSSQSVLTKLDTGGDIIAAALASPKSALQGRESPKETASGFVARFTAAEWILSRSGPKFDCAVYMTEPTLAADGIQLTRKDRWTPAHGFRSADRICRRVSPWGASPRLSARI